MNSPQENLKSMAKNIKDFKKIHSLPTDDLAHKLDIDYDSAEALQRIVGKELENLRLNVITEEEIEKEDQ